MDRSVDRIDGQMPTTENMVTHDVIKSADPIPFQLDTTYWCSNAPLQIHQNILERIRLDDQHRLHLAECPLVS